LCQNIIRKGIKYLLKIRDKKRLIWDSCEVHWPEVYRKHSTDLYFTSVVGLVFMLSGSTHKKGDHKAEISSALEYLKKKIPKVRVPTRRRVRVGFQLPFVLLFLSEIYRIEKDKDIKACALRVIKLLESSQYRNGGWGYGEKARGIIRGITFPNTCATLFSLMVAKRASLKVSEKRIQRGIRCIKRFANRDGSFRYRLKSKGSHASTPGGAIVVLRYAGETDSKIYKQACRYFKKNIFKTRRHIKRLPERYRDLGTSIQLFQNGGFNGFFASLAAYYLGKEMWQKWYKERLIKGAGYLLNYLTENKHLPKRIKYSADGSLQLMYFWGEGAAMALLTLQIPSANLLVISR
jgi:hypothetical protein